MQIREAEKVDVQNIVEMFDREYDTYFGKYIEEEQLTEHINEMPSEEEFVNQASAGEEPEELVVVIEDGEFIGSGGLEAQSDRMELKSTMVKDDRRKERVEGRTGYERLFERRLEHAEGVIESDEGPAIAYTQPVSAKTAGTQHVASKNGFVPTGLYDNKYFEVYPGRGRVSVVNMVYANSDFETSGELYLPQEVHTTAEQVVESINKERSDRLEDIEREVTDGEYSGEYSVSCEVLPEPFNIADIKIKTSGNGRSLESVIDEIGRIEETLQEHEDDYWMKACLDAESPMAVEAANELKDYGFDYAGINLDSIDGRDALEMQKRPGPMKERQFIPSVMELINSLGIDYEEETRRSSEYSGKYVSI